MDRDFIFFISFFIFIGIVILVTIDLELSEDRRAFCENNKGIYYYNGNCAINDYNDSITRKKYEIVEDKYGNYSFVGLR